MSIEAMKQALEGVASMARCGQLDAFIGEPWLNAVFAAIEAAEKTDNSGPINDGWQLSVSDGHSGRGVYAYMTEYPEEGAVFLMPIEAAEKQEPVAWVKEVLDAFPLFEDDGLDEEMHHCEWALQQDRKRLHAMLTTPPAAPVQEPDLSGLKPDTQKAIKGWIADGTFVERAIGALQEQERENMRLEKLLAAPVQGPPVLAELLCVCGAEWEWRNRDWELVSTPAAPVQEPVNLHQVLTDPENQPNQYGVEFGMHGEKMMFKVGVQQFALDYEPDTQDEFNFMRDMLIHAFSTFTRDVKTNPPAAQRQWVGLTDDKVDAARWRWLAQHIQVAWDEGKFTSLVRIVSDENRQMLNASIDRMMAGDWSDADRHKADIEAKLREKNGGAA